MFMVMNNGIYHGVTGCVWCGAGDMETPKIGWMM